MGFKISQFADETSPTLAAYFPIIQGGTNKRLTLQRQLELFTLLEPKTVTADYTLILTDRVKKIRINSATATVFTIPPNSAVAFPVGVVIPLRGVGAGVATITAGTGVTVNADTYELEQNQDAVLHKVATDEWDLAIGSAGSGTPPPSGNHPDTDLLITAIEATTYGPVSAGDETLINTIIQGLDDDAAWDNLEYFNIPIFANAQANAINWKNPGGTAGIFVNMDHTTSGIKPTAATTGYLRTGIIPSASSIMLQNNSFFGIYSMEDTGSVGYDVGAVDGSSNRFELIIDAAGSYYGINGPEVGPITAPTNKAGWFVVRRTGASATAMVRNGTVFNSSTGTSTARPTVELTFLALNNNGIFTSGSPRKLSAMAAGANPTDINYNYKTRIDTFLTGKGITLP